MLRANIDYERGFFGGLTITVQGPSGSRTFYGEEGKEEAIFQMKYFTESPEQEQMPTVV